MFKTVTRVWVKRFNTNIVVFVLLGTVKEKATKCYLKTTGGFFWMLMDMSLPKFDIYLGTGATKFFKGHTKS